MEQGLVRLLAIASISAAIVAGVVGLSILLERLSIKHQWSHVTDLVITAIGVLVLVVLLAVAMAGVMS